jgi:hypothetical protein
MSSTRMPGRSGIASAKASANQIGFGPIAFSTSHRAGYLPDRG